MARNLIALFLIISATSVFSFVIGAPLVSLFLENPETPIISPESFSDSLKNHIEATGTALPTAIFWEGSNRERPSDFLLTIEKLGIVNARVNVDTDISSVTAYTPILKKNLAHVAGTPLPGEWGSSFILGHSALPLFYNPSNFETVFTRLVDLDPGDEITVEYQNQEKIQFKVSEKRILDYWKRPENILTGGGRKIVLMTCYPPGFTLKRLILVAKLALPED